MAQPEKSRADFLEALRDGQPVTRASETVTVGRTTLYRWRRTDPEFAAEWDEAYEQGTDVLEAEAQRRAVDDSDALLIFLLKSRRPKRFRENVKHDVEVTAPLDVELRSTLGDLADIARILAGAGAIPPPRSPDPTLD